MKTTLGHGKYRDDTTRKDISLGTTRQGRKGQVKNRYIKAGVKASV